MKKNDTKPVIKANAVEELLSKGVIKKQTFDTKYKDGANSKSKQKQRLYFMGSVYQDTDVFTKSEIKDGVLIKKAIKHKSHGEEAKDSTNFATLFNFNDQNDVVIQQPYDGRPSIFGIMYKDYNTLFYGKKDSYGEKSLKDIKQRRNDECGKIISSKGKKLYFGKNLNKEQDYLRRFDNYEQRVRVAINETKKNLNINNIFEKNRNEEIKKELLKNFKLKYKNNDEKDEAFYVNINVDDKTVQIGPWKGFCGIFSPEKDAIIEKSGAENCNEFVSVQDEKVASAFFFCKKNSLEDFFTNDVYTGIADKAKEEARKKEIYYNYNHFISVNEEDFIKQFNQRFDQQYDQNFCHLLECQKKIGLPYIPILYKNDGFGFRLENMKLSVFAKKINDGFITNGKKPLFSEAEIQEFEKFESEFDFENIQKEDQQDDNGKNTAIKLENKNNNILNNEIDCKGGNTVDQKIKTSSAEAGQGQSLLDRLKSKCHCCFGGNENEIINTVNVNPGQLAIENKI